MLQTMKIQLLLGFALLTIFAPIRAQDISTLLMDQRVVQRGIRCVLETGACDAIGRQIKNLLPEALNNNCERCNPRQKRSARKLMQFMQSNYPIEWNAVVKRYATNNIN